MRLWSRGINVVSSWRWTHTIHTEDRQPFYQFCCEWDLPGYWYSNFTSCQHRYWPVYTRTPRNLPFIAPSVFFHLSLSASSTARESLFNLLSLDPQISCYRKLNAHAKLNPNRNWGGWLEFIKMTAIDAERGIYRSRYEENEALPTLKEPVEYIFPLISEHISSRVLIFASQACRRRLPTRNPGI